MKFITLLLTVFGSPEQNKEKLEYYQRYQLERTHDNVEEQDHIKRRAEAWKYVTIIRSLEQNNEHERDGIFLEDIILSMATMRLYQECEDKTGYSVIKR